MESVYAEERHLCIIKKFSRAIQSFPFFFSSNPHAKTEKPRLPPIEAAIVCSHSRSRRVSNQCNNIRILQAQQH